MNGEVIAVPEDMELASQIEKQYREGLQYKRRMEFATRWPEYERFKAGDQWPAATPRTRNLPRPVFNIIDHIESHKVASVMNENIKMVFSAAEGGSGVGEAAADLFTRLADTTWEHIKQGQLNEEALEDASNRGTGIWHYFWDNSREGGRALAWKGEMRGEIIDPMNFFPGNPQSRDVQRQPHIIISSRELVSAVQEEARAAGMGVETVNAIKGDRDTQDEGYDSARVEMNDNDKVTVLTRYWRDRQTGTVWFAKAGSGVLVKPAADTGMRLYPLVVMQWKKRPKSIFGIGDTEGLIPNQKAINFLMAMQLLSVQLTGWPKLRYKPGAIDPGKITNAPGEMIEDKSATGGWGVDYMLPGTFNNQAQMLVERFIDYTKEISGAQEAAMGEAPSADLNASAIMLLQKAAGVPLEGIRRRFYQAMEDVGRIWEEFWKVKYNTRRLVSVKGDDGQELAVEFTGTDHAGAELNLKIDVGPASSYSESLMMASLDRFLEKQYIGFDQYLRYAPKNVVPFKDRLLREVQPRVGPSSGLEIPRDQVPIGDNNSGI
ncbi:MAG: hypothetical protein HPY50_04770 [Firmicutes bacterium]|nr:hypothetical protein [Bacillota bacterium]